MGNLFEDICENCGNQRRCHLWPNHNCPVEANNETGRTNGKYLETVFKENK